MLSRLRFFFFFFSSSGAGGGGGGGGCYNSLIKGRGRLYPVPTSTRMHM